jgi:CHAT domain-containing protein/tetratricopeptide (TPR) repeat protein
MATRLVWFSMFLFACSIFLLHASAVVAEPFQQSPVAAEPSGPKPSAEVQKILDEAVRLAEAKQPLDSLKAADQALEAARQTSDSVGRAFAQEARARALKDLNRRDEGLAAWKEAARLSSEIGDTPRQIIALVQAGLLSFGTSKPDAEKSFAQGLAIGKSETQRLDALAQALYDSGVIMGDQGQQAAAMDYLKAALSTREAEAPESLKLIETLNALAKTAINLGIVNYDDKYEAQAKDYAARAVEICRRLAPDSSLMALSLYWLGESEYQLSGGLDANARDHLLEALRIEKQLAPGGSTKQARFLRDLGNLEETQTNFSAAREYLEEAVAMGERLAPESDEFEHALENLANVEGDEGDLPAAHDHLQRALSLKEKLHGDLAPTYVNLGAVAADQSDFASARDYFEKAAALFAKSMPNGVGIPIALGDLSETLYRQGDYASALEYGRRALALNEKSGESLMTAASLSGIADILRAQGEFSSAGDYYHKALDMREKLSPGSYNVSDSLFSLGKLARAQRNITLALEYDRRALQLGQKSCPNSWCVARVVNDLGELAYEQGDLAGSESYLRQAVELREKSLGPMHPDLARSLNALAITMATLGRTQEALERALRAERIGAEHLRVSARSLSERQALAYEGIRASGLDLALTLAADRTAAPSARGQVFEAVIRSRALVFDELAARHRSAYRSGDPEVTHLADQLSSARARFATLVFRGVGDTTPEAYRKLLDEARERKEKAERLLAEKSLGFRQEQTRTQLGFKEIAASLPQRAALVAFVRYGRYDLQQPRTRNMVPEPVPSYAAFVLRAGEHEPLFVRLGAAGAIERLMAAWRRDVARQAEAMDASAKTGESAYRRSGSALRRRVWDPLVPGLGGAHEVLVVPDAALHLLSLASLPVGSSQYLVETGPLIHYLSTERDLVPAQSHHGEGILVVGNPAFDQLGKLVVASSQQSASASPATGTAGTLLRGTRSACGTFQTLRFPPLPASEQEAENIAALWKRSISGEGTIPPTGEVLEMTGADASPQAFEQYAPGKRVLHVATHGFFLEDNCESAVQRRSDVSQRDENLLPTTAENPLRLSGLAFAGANRHASAKADEPDGILSAEEIAGINLQGVDWAVLSACDTGVGEIKAGEGVFGLQRAFQVAGAKTVIMSLWPVEDDTTRQWMGTLYREHFLNGKDTGQSVRAASLQILRQRRAQHQSTHPFYWGAFIAAGDRQ